eukprot:3601463-Rhodomonas_salina.1
MSPRHEVVDVEILTAPAFKVWSSRRPGSRPLSLAAWISLFLSMCEMLWLQEGHASLKRPARGVTVWKCLVMHHRLAMWRQTAIQHTSDVSSNMLSDTAATEHYPLSDTRATE